MFEVVLSTKVRLFSRTAQPHTLYTNYCSRFAWKFCHVHYFASAFKATLGGSRIEQ